MAGGMRIDQHNNWTGKAPKGQVFADGAKMKEESSAEGDGHLPTYEDTTEAIKSVQMKGANIAKAHSMKPGNRN